MPTWKVAQSTSTLGGPSGTHELTLPSPSVNCYVLPIRAHLLSYPLLTQAHCQISAGQSALPHHLTALLLRLLSPRDCISRTNCFWLCPCPATAAPSLCTLRPGSGFGTEKAWLQADERLCLHLSRCPAE